MKSILRGLYNGDIIPWERRNPDSENEDFSCGFRLGAGLMIEAFISGNGFSCDSE